MSRDGDRVRERVRQVPCANGARARTVRDYVKADDGRALQSYTLKYALQIRAAEQRGDRQRAEELRADLRAEISAEISAAEQRGDRQRAEELRAELRAEELRAEISAAEQRGDRQRAAELRAELRAQTKR